MLILGFARLAFISIVLFLMVTQIIVPAFKGTKLFPLFLKDRKSVASRKEELKEKLELCKDEVEIAEIQKQIDELTAKKESLKSK